MMRLLVEATINGTLHRISNQVGIALDHYWDPYIKSIDSPQYQIEFPYGGYVRPGFGNVRFSQSLFAADWPPPVNLDLALYLTASDEASRSLLFDGKAHFKDLTRQGVSYRLYGPSYTAEVADATAFDDTLVNIAAWFCDPTRLNLTLDTTYARVPSPAVKFTTSGSELAINLLSGVCAFFTHLFYIQGSTLYLVDMLADAGSQTITEFDFFPSTYTGAVPVSLARTTNFSRPSTYPYGDELVFPGEYHDTQANVEAALDDVILIANSARCSLRIPMRGNIPVPGEAIHWTDTAMAAALNAYIRCRTLTYDFDNEKVVVDGEGVLS